MIKSRLFGRALLGVALACLAVSLATQVEAAGFTAAGGGGGTAPPPYGARQSGKWYLWAPQPVATGANMSANTLYCDPVTKGDSSGITGLAVKVTTGGTSGGLLSIFLYQTNAAGQPTTAIATAPDISTNVSAQVGIGNTTPFTAVQLSAASTYVVCEISNQNIGLSQAANATFALIIPDTTPGAQIPSNVSGLGGYSYSYSYTNTAPNLTSATPTGSVNHFITEYQQQ